MPRYMVQFDKEFLSGNLEGLKIPGQTCTWPNYKLAQKHAALLERCERESDFMRDAVTHARYRVSNIQLFPV